VYPLLMSMVWSAITSSPESPMERSRSNNDMGGGEPGVSEVLSEVEIATEEWVRTNEPQPPSGRLSFHPGANGPEHHGNAPPDAPELDEEVEVASSPKMPKSEKAVVVHETVLAPVSTVHEESALQLDPS